MIAKRPSILLGVAMATVGVALLAPVLGASAGGGGGSTHGSLPTGTNQNPNAGSGGTGSGSKNGSLPTGPNQNPNAGTSSSSGSGSGSSGGKGSGNGSHPVSGPPYTGPPRSGPTGGGRAARANDDHHNCGNGIEPVIASAAAPACASAVGALA
jgi:hypothetical protein